jgi:uncharacterized membrane protein
MNRAKTPLRWVMSIVMVAVGIVHFAYPAPFVAIVPAWLPNPALLVAISGIFEILGGVGLQVRSARRLAAWGLVALYIAVFPANLNQAMNHIEFPGSHTPSLLFWARLPLQLVFIAWAYWYTRPDKT